MGNWVGLEGERVEGPSVHLADSSRPLAPVPSRASRLTCRVWFNPPSRNLDWLLKTSIPTGFGSELLKFGGLKVFCDGALGARTAAISEAYADDALNRGMLMHGRDD